MKNIKKISLVIALVLIMAMAVSCSPQSMIAGTWVKQETVLGIVTESSYVFREDGTGTMSTVLGIDIPMMYTIDSSKINIKIDTLDVAESVLEQLGIDYSIEYTYTLIGNKLTLNDGKKDIELTRK